MSVIPDEVARKVAAGVMKAKANSPRLFFVAGVAGVISGTVLACRATTKLDDTLSEVKEEIAETKREHAADEIDEKTYSRGLTNSYLRGSVEVAKLYGPSVLVSAAGLGLLTGSHITLSRRNAAITAAYAAAQEGWDQYRDRVREEVGEEKEFTLYYKAEWKDVEGSEGMMQELEVGSFGPYTRWYDPTNVNWRNDHEMNRIFLKSNEDFFNQQLQRQGFVFLNDIYDALGIPRSSVGQLVGWVIGGNGDDYIDFGGFEPKDKTNSPITGEPPSILLDFNPDGIVYDFID